MYKHIFDCIMLLWRGVLWPTSLAVPMTTDDTSLSFLLCVVADPLTTLCCSCYGNQNPCSHWAKPHARAFCCVLCVRQRPFEARGLNAVCRHPVTWPARAWRHRGSFEHFCCLQTSDSTIQKREGEGKSTFCCLTLYLMCSFLSCARTYTKVLDLVCADVLSWKVIVMLLCWFV